MVGTDNGFMYQLINALQKSGNISLAYAFQKEMMYQRLYQQQEYEKIVHAAAEEVLSRLSATVDVQEIFDKIDGLNDKINSLERK